ncbi:hypothetical protein LXM94_19215, partial [Rhizobium sp. TRM95111]|nr:hypothetical protein [Rhizobium alarense]
LFVVLLVIDPTSHELGSPANPARFTEAECDEFAGLMRFDGRGARKATHPRLARLPLRPPKEAEQIELFLRHGKAGRTAAAAGIAPAAPSTAAIVVVIGMRERKDRRAPTRRSFRAHRENECEGRGDRDNADRTV